MTDPCDISSDDDHVFGLRRLFNRETGKEWVEPAAIPAWVMAAARVLFDQMEGINANALNVGRANQDSFSAKMTWQYLVADVILQEYRKSRQ